jgi:hydroxymethylglutaryl-CoA reductase
MGLPRRFRKLDMKGRRAALAELYGSDPAEALATACPAGLEDLADVMVESAVGALPVPLGVATGFVVDGVERVVPMATEEPSVIAAASYGARIAAPGGGFRTWSTEPVMAAHVYLEGVSMQGEASLLAAEPRLREELLRFLESMESRGGGYRGMSVARVPPGLVRVELLVDVRDAMGANALNSAAEHARATLEEASGGHSLMAILSNAARDRRAGARVAIPFGDLGPACPPGMDPAELARRVAVASIVAREDPDRAVTHNKGIMNGITALALATGNDTRAVEAGAHAWAARSGQYRALSSFSVATDARGSVLSGELELPLALGSLGGSVGFHPATAYCLRLLGNPSGAELARIAAAVGLAQNLAALLALVGEGIQKGHMRLHAARLAYRAGARGAEIPVVAARLAELLAARGTITAAEATATVNSVRTGGNR